MAWLDRLDPGPRPARVDKFLDRYGDESSREAAAALARALVDDGMFAPKRNLERGLAAARRRFLRTRRRRATADRILPGLNG
jgi:hypothetical protein